MKRGLWIFVALALIATALGAVLSPDEPFPQSSVVTCVSLPGSLNVVET